jgi:hypothetical protein
MAQKSTPRFYLFSVPMRFTIGEIICNRVTQERGRIVRLAEPTGDRPCYVVSIILKPESSMNAIEAIWRETEVREIGPRDPNSPTLCLLPHRSQDIDPMVSEIATPTQRWDRTSVSKR